MATSPDSVTYTQTIAELVAPEVAPDWSNVLRPVDPQTGMFGVARETGNFEFYNGTTWVTPVMSGGAATLSSLTVTGGIVAGSPTGGNKGAGTINAQTLYRNGTALTTASVTSIGTSGATIPVCNGVNSWGQPNTFGAGNTAYSMRAQNNITDASFASTTSAQGALFGISVNVAPSTPDQSVFTVASTHTAQIAAPTGSFSITTTALAVGGATSLTVSSIVGVPTSATIATMLSDGTPFVVTLNGAPSGSSLPLSTAVPAAGISNGTTIYIAFGHAQGAITTGYSTAGVTGSVGAFGIEGIEANISVVSGSAPPVFKAVMAITPNKDDAVAGLLVDADLSISATATSIGMKNGILFNPISGRAPVTTTGNLIATMGSATVANGVDFTSYTFTTNAFASPSFAVDGSGVVTAASYKSGSSQVVGSRNTGWTAMTGSTNKATAYDTATVTLAQLAGRVMALQAALTTHGLIGT